MTLEVNKFHHKQLFLFKQAHSDHKRFFVGMLQGKVQDGK